MLMVAWLVVAWCDFPGASSTSTPDASEQTTYNQDSWKDVIADSCQSFNDGCNQCMRGENGEVACTRMYCEEYQEPYCTDDQNNEPADMDDSSQSSGIDRSLYIGHNFEDAQAQAARDGVSIRAVYIDGEPQAVTADYRPGRLNVEIEDNIVIWLEIEWRETQDNYIGLTSAEAQSLAESSDTPFRIVSIDGEPQAITLDLRPWRINASTENDIVVDVQVE